MKEESKHRLDWIQYKISVHLAGEDISTLQELINDIQYKIDGISSEEGLIKP